MSSKKVLLEVATQREQCCHTGGGMVFDSKGNLFLTTGDNTSPRDTPFNPIDEREGRGPWDAQKSSGSTNDLRGKIIRIHPEADGTYTIPEGNLFPKSTANSGQKTRPEIYTMGHRNPWRISVDSKRATSTGARLVPTPAPTRRGAVLVDTMNLIRQKDREIMAGLT
jgi:cytochrome c